jgi:hypothetical protein
MRYRDEAREAELEWMVGQLTMENTLLTKLCCGSKGAEGFTAELAAEDGRGD